MKETQLQRIDVKMVANIPTNVAYMDKENLISTVLMKG